MVVTTLKLVWPELVQGQQSQLLADGNSLPSGEKRGRGQELTMAIFLTLHFGL